MASVPPFDPIADPSATVVAGQARFTVLTPRLIRLEWSPQADFEDRASLAIVQRRLPVPDFDVRRRLGRVELRTHALTLRYIEDAGKFDAENLAIEFGGPDPTVWTPGAGDDRNLGGTWRTLDGYSGASPLERGLLSRNGWKLLDDSTRLLLSGSNDSPPDWAAVRRDPDAIDWYFFAYGDDFPQALLDFTKIAGPIPLPPRYVFGAWWSRYWPYRDQDLVALVGEFRQHDVPLDVLVVDMDWHLDGWTGYTWNPRYFPMPERFLAWATEEGLKIPLNLHPHDGVGRHEAAFETMCDAMDLDPETTTRVPFDPADPRYMDAYFTVLHHPLERQGVDFWWIDWQQGESTQIPGLDPLFWLNHLHWRDWQKRPGVKPSRPLIFSRWGGIGNHRYPIGFSGDTFSDWDSLAWQPHFTATAGNVGYAYWSHDLGGHQPGPAEPELQTRWLQWGALSPVFRVHATRHPDAERRIWALPPEHFAVSRKAWLLRYQLTPYLYTMSRKTFDTALPLCRPMYLHWPKLDPAYGVRGQVDFDPSSANAYAPARRLDPRVQPGFSEQYMLGDDLLVAPITRPMHAASRTASARVWLPPGRWRNWFTGELLEGPRNVHIACPLDEYPLFARDGVAIPLAPPMKSTGEKPLDPLILRVFPSSGDATHQLRLYEDDGLTDAYRDDRCAWTPIRTTSSADGCRIDIAAIEGDFDGRLAQRSYQFELRDVARPSRVTLDGRELAPSDTRDAGSWQYDAGCATATIRIGPILTDRPCSVQVDLPGDAGIAQRLAHGLRGELTVLAEIAATSASESAPASSGLAARLLSAWTAPSEASGTTMPAPIDVARELAALDPTDPARLKALARLLNVYADLRVLVTSEAPESLAVRFECGVGRPPVGAAARVEAILSNGPGSPPAGPIETDPLTDDGTILLSQRLMEIPSLPQTFTLSASVRIALDTATIELPVQRVVFPSINGWWIAGPFPREDAGRLNPEFTTLQSVDPGQTWEGFDAAWKRVVRDPRRGGSPTAEFVVDLREELGKNCESCVAYAFTRLVAPRAMTVQLAIGSDDGCVVWINGQEFHRNLVQRPYSSRQDVISVPLREGANTLLVRIEQISQRWAFGVHVEAPGGAPVPEIAVSIDD